jgi:hypothetical protein
MTVGVAVLAGLVTVALLFRLFFRDLEDFQDCLDYALKPDMLSWVSGDLGADLWAELKLGAWIGCGLIVGLGVYVGLEKVFG